MTWEELLCHSALSFRTIHPQHTVDHGVGVFDQDVVLGKRGMDRSRGEGFLDAGVAGLAVGDVGLQQDSRAIDEAEEHEVARPEFGHLGVDANGV